MTADAGGWRFGADVPSCGTVSATAIRAGSLQLPRAMSSPTRPESGTSELQFDRAIPAGGDGTSGAPAMTCPRCQRPIRTHYYHVDGAPVCPACKQTVETALAKRRSPTTMMRAAFFGLGASVVGALIYYAVLAILDLQIGIVAILTGYIVAKAVRRGADGAGGRRYQIMAVALTYFSVAMAYAPFAVQGYTKSRDAKAAAVARAHTDSVAAAAAAAASDAIDSATSANPTPAVATTDSATPGTTATGTTDSTLADATDSSTATAPAAVAAPAAAPKRLTSKPKKLSAPRAALAVLAALVFVIGLTLALPVIVTIGSLPGGILGALIIGFGLRQAWRLTAEDTEKITGPYKVAAAPAEG